MEHFLSNKNKQSETSLSKTKSDHCNKTKRKTDKPGIRLTKAKHNTDTTDVHSDLSEQLGSFCPKMEPDSGAEDNVCSSVGDSASLSAAVVNRNKIWEKETSKANEKVTRRVTENEASRTRDISEDTVASVLDDFSASYVAPRQSPRKISRYMYILSYLAGLFNE